MADQIGALLDTSILIAQETGRPLRVADIPDGPVISVVTLAELRLAILNAGDTPTQARCLQTLERALRVQAIPIDETIAFNWAVLRSAARSLSQSRINDLWIAATAMALRVPVVTQDEGFVRLSQVGGPEAILI